MEAAANGEECEAPMWSPTTNWIADEGSLCDSISFDTSDNIENDQESKPLLLLKPDGDDPPPCEITIYFREKHEIHRVYVRSTARVYEIYYTSDNQDSNKEYLCTVRCGAAIEEDIRESLNGCQENNNGNLGHVARNDSNTSDEDGWVQVKTPDSLLQDDKEYFVARKRDSGRDSPKMQIHYEATAEISDCSPCFSITIRLLSIQTKNCVHVEEIYVYADPVESCDPDPPVTMDQNLGASSMFAMLVPSIMQLSKSVTRGDKSLSAEARVPKHQYGSDKSEQTVLSTANTVTPEFCFGRPPDKQWIPDQEQMEAKAVRLEVTAPQQMPDSLADQHNNQAYSRIEKVLDDLVRKVGRIEAFCSKFEENMLMPFDCMEKRLQRLEQKLDALAVKSQSSETCHCLKVASSESDEYMPENEDGHTKHTKQIEDTTLIAMTLPADEGAPSVLESRTHPGLIIKAPEFPNEDDEHSNIDDSVGPLMEDFLKNKKTFSIENALASSLAAFLTSTTVKSPNPIPSKTAISQEGVNGDNSALDSLAMVPYDEPGSFSNKSIEVNGYDFLDAARRGSIIDAKFSSNIKNTGCGKPDAETECTTFDDSLCPLVMPLEFPNRYSSFNYDGTIDTPELDHIDVPASITVPPLAEFLALTTAQCPKSIPQFNAPCGSSSIANNESSVSIAEIPSEGPDESGIENQEETEIKDEVYLDPAPSMPPLIASFAQEDCTACGSHGGVTENCPGENCVDDSDAEKAIVHGFNLHDEGRTEDSNYICSSIDDNLIKHILDTEWSVGGSSDPFIETSGIADHGKLRGATYYSECDKASEDRNWPLDGPNKEMENNICNVKFTSDGTSTSGLPLELLLGEMADAKSSEASIIGGDGGGIDIEQLLPANSLLTLCSDLEDVADGSFLSEVTAHSSFESTGG